MSKISKTSTTAIKTMRYVLPVIHHLDRDTTWEQAEIAYKSGADGIFLISHFGEDGELGPLASQINCEGWMVGKTPFKIGLNLLNTPALEAFDIVEHYALDSLWLDHAGISSQGLSPLAEELIEKMMIAQDITVLASVAFKYQALEPDPAKAAFIAKDHGFIATTSGTKTGMAPTLDKIKSMSAQTDGCLAIASGMNVGNIAEFSPYLSHILVATGVCLDDYHFDQKILQEFIDIYKHSALPQSITGFL